MKRIIATLLLMTFSSSLFAADVITVKGSDTMVILAQRWAEPWHASQPKPLVPLGSTPSTANPRAHAQAQELSEA